MRQHLAHHSSPLLGLGLALTLGLLAGSVTGYVQADSDPHTTSSGASDYPWLADMGSPLPSVTSLRQRFDPPEGFVRLPAPARSYAAWLRELPLRTDRTTVLSHDGTELVRPSAALVLLDVGRRDLMQCADSIIRIHAEFLWAQGRADEAGYHFTSGDLSRWTDWQEGERFVITGNKVKRIAGKARADTHASYRRWLDLIFTYAGTTSLARDAWTPPEDEPTEAGDFFVDPGFPGHAVIVLDLAEDEAGRRIALLAQGFMPAEEIHVLRSSEAIDDHWFLLPRSAEAQLDTPSWRPFPRAARRRFR